MLSIFINGEFVPCLLLGLPPETMVTYLNILANCQVRTATKETKPPQLRRQQRYIHGCQTRYDYCIRGPRLQSRPLSTRTYSDRLIEITPELLYSGDSGSFCLDSRGTPCGLVFGGNEEAGAAYVMPTSWVYKDILERTRARIISPDLS